MATNRNKDIFAEPSLEEDEVIATPAPANAGFKRSRVKGTWTMYWGRQVFDFEDGKTYNLPVDLFEHLKKHGNIYDTL